MDDAMHAAIDDLRQTIDKQMHIQTETNDLLRRLIQATAEHSQELLELRQAMNKPKATVKAPVARSGGARRN